VDQRSLSLEHLWWVGLQVPVEEGSHVVGTTVFQRRALMIALALAGIAALLALVCSCDVNGPCADPPGTLEVSDPNELIMDARLRLNPQPGPVDADDPTSAPGPPGWDLRVEFQTYACQERAEVRLTALTSGRYSMLITPIPEEPSCDSMGARRAIDLKTTEPIDPAQVEVHVED
jgi:hypothetical protein